MTGTLVDARDIPEQRASALTVACLTAIEQMEQLGDEWRALFARIGETLPFATPEWAMSWWSHLRRDNRGVRDSLRVFTLRDAHDELVAVAPMMLTERFVLGVPVLRSLQPIGTDPNITEVRGMLVAEEREAEVVAALAQFCVRQGGYDEVQWCGLRRADPVLARLRTIAPAKPIKEIPAYLLTLPASWEELKSALPRNIRESLRKCYNSLTRDGHAWSLRVVNAPDEVAASAGRLIELHGRRAARVDTVRHRDCFESPAARRFLIDVAERLARQGAVRVFELRIGDDIVAVRLAFVFGDQMYLYYSGYDPAWGKYSVMTTTVAEALKYAIASGIATANLSTGADESKLRWRPREVRYTNVTSRGPGLRARVVSAASVGRAVTLLRHLRDRH